ncbi:MAG: hypothetical protein WBO46_14960 [Caldilineaceae bacterium]
MAVAAKHTKLLIDEFNFSGDSNSLSLTTAVAALEDTGFQATGTTFVPGLPSGSLSHGGYYSGKGAGYVEQELKARLGTASTVYVAALFGTNGVARAYVLDTTWGSNLSMEMPIDGLITLSGEWPGVGKLRRGLVVFDGTISATGGQTSVDFGAAGSVGGEAYLFVQAITGTATDATIDVESDADDNFAAGATVEGTFTFSLASVQKVTMSGAVLRYIRINATDMGGATDFRVVAVVCVDGVTG